MVATRRLSRLLADVEDRARIPTGPILVALSGGADSAALAALIGRTGEEVSALHLHHGFHASDRLESAARATADQLGIPVRVERINPAPGPGLEGRARVERYACFARALQRGGRLATGHTLDDLAETVLMRLARGSGLDGLSGIAEERGPFVRPLLRVRRSETRELATLLGLPWIDDPSNESQAILRNRVRRVLVPALTATFGRDPSVSIALSALQLQEERGFLDRLTAGYLPMVESGRVSIGLAVLSGLDPVPAARVVRRMWLALGFEHPPGAEALGRAMAVAAGRMVSSQLGGGVVARIEGSSFVLALGSAGTGATGYLSIIATEEEAWDRITP